jgi:hypothetical protein
MNIISKYKEYYDYIQSFYGIDKDIVLDRRKTWEGSYVTDGGSWFLTNKNHHSQYYAIEIGTNQYVIKVTYKTNENCNINGNIYRPDNYMFILDKVELIHVFISEKQLIDIQINSKSDGWVYSHYNRQRKEDITTNSPTNVYQIDDDIFKFVKGDKIRFNDIVSHSYRMNNDEYVKLDKVAGLIPAQEAYDAIYNFLINKREPNVVDSRTDVQKLEGNGFDKKTSFRNM